MWSWKKKVVHVFVLLLSEDVQREGRECGTHIGRISSMGSSWKTGRFVCVCVFIPTDLKSSVNAGSTGTGRETQRDYETCEIRLNGHDCDSASVSCDIIRETLEAGENVTECRRIFIICTCVWGHVCDLSAAYYSRLNVWINNMETMQCHKVVTFIYVWRPGRLHECESVDFTLKFNTCSKTDKYYIIFDKLKKLKLIITKLLR